MDWELEELARVWLERANVGVQVDADLLALRLDYEVCDAPTEGCIVPPHIFVSELLRPERRAFTICHELAHEVLRLSGFNNWKSEQAASYLGSALLLPRDDFDRDLKRIGWDLIALKARHRHASFEALARRIVALREAHAVIWDKPLCGQRRPGWYAIPRHHRPSREEREAAAHAVATGSPIELRAGLTAWPVLQHDWHRVITITAT